MQGTDHGLSYIESTCLKLNNTFTATEFRSKKMQINYPLAKPQIHQSALAYQTNTLGSVYSLS